MATPNRRRRRDAQDGRVRLRRDDHGVAEAGGRGDPGRRAAARDLDRQGRHRVPEPGTGVVQQILVQEGETVEVGTRLAVIGAPRAAPHRRRRSSGDGRRRPSRRRRRRPQRPSAPPPAPKPRRRLRAGEAALRPSRLLRLRRRRPLSDVSDDGKSFVSPVVARIASEHNVDVSQVEGTGRGGA